MGYEDIELTKIRMNEALKMGLESQRVHREMAADGSGIRESLAAFRRKKLLATRLFISHFGKNLYCHTLEFIYAKPVCV